MGQCIVKLDGRYLLWSSVVDAPVSRGMTREELEEWTRFKYGEQGMLELPGRLERADTKGTSSLDSSDGDEVMWLNRAGKGETRLTRKQIADFYVEGGAEGESPKGYVDIVDGDECGWTPELFKADAPPPFVVVVAGRTAKDARTGKTHRVVTLRDGRRGFYDVDAPTVER